jgi:hypothetical protein
MKGMVGRTKPFIVLQNPPISLSYANFAVLVIPAALNSADVSYFSTNVIATRFGVGQEVSYLSTNVVVAIFDNFSATSYLTADTIVAPAPDYAATSYLTADTIVAPAPNSVTASYLAPATIVAPAPNSVTASYFNTNTIVAFAPDYAATSYLTTDTIVAPAPNSVTASYVNSASIVIPDSSFVAVTALNLNCIITEQRTAVLTIVAQSDALVAIVNNAASFYVVATSAADLPIAYQWEAKSPTEENFTAISGATSAVLNLVELTENENNYLYRCRVQTAETVLFQETVIYSDTFRATLDKFDITAAHTDVLTHEPLSQTPQITAATIDVLTNAPAAQTPQITALHTDVLTRTPIPTPQSVSGFLTDVLTYGTEVAFQDDNIARITLRADATNVNVMAETTTGYFKIRYPDGDIDTQPYRAYYYWSGGIAPLTNLPVGVEKVIEIISCDGDGEPAGDLTYISLHLNSNTSAIVAVDISGCTQLTGANFNASTQNPSYYTWFSSLPSAITRIRAVGVRIGTGRVVGSANAYWWSHTYYDRGLQISGHLLSAEALDQLYADLAPTTGGYIFVGDNPGVADHTPSIATAKGYTVFGA